LEQRIYHGNVQPDDLANYLFVRGINTYGLYQNIWQAVDTFCAQAGARSGNTTTAHAVYCQQCGSVNEEGARFCQMCGAPLSAAGRQG
jgi:hypothetical protein